MTGKADEVVRLARGWIGTPYRHQQATKGAGCDCLGLLRGIWAEMGGAGLPDLPPYTPDWSEPQGQETLWDGARALLRQKPSIDAAPGDILLFRMRKGAVAKHLGVQAETGASPSFIHSYQGHGVVESPLSAPWARRIVARFEFPKKG